MTVPVSGHLNSRILVRNVLLHVVDPLLVISMILILQVIVRSRQNGFLLFAFGLRADLELLGIVHVLDGVVHMRMRASLQVLLLEWLYLHDYLLLTGIPLRSICQFKVGCSSCNSNDF